jgi:hypothetical protein
MTGAVNTTDAAFMPPRRDNKEVQKVTEHRSHGSLSLFMICLEIRQMTFAIIK